MQAWKSATGDLAQLGLELSLFYSVDLLANLDGGLERRSGVVGSLDLLMLADMEKLGGWRGARLFLYGLGNHGRISDAVGDATVVGMRVPISF